MARNISDEELGVSIERMRETVLARLEMKKPAIDNTQAADHTGAKGQEEGFTIRRLWDRFFSFGD